jgi:hypothetical protein
MNLFHDMQEKGFKPQDVTLVNILSAGSHSQLYEQVLAIFASIQQSYGIEPSEQICNVVVYTLARSGMIEEAIIFAADSKTSSVETLDWPN